MDLKLNTDSAAVYLARLVLTLIQITSNYSWKSLKWEKKSHGAPLQHHKCYSSNVEVKLSTWWSSKSFGYKDYNDKSHHLRWVAQLGKLPCSVGVTEATTHWQHLPSLLHRQTLTGLACHFHRSFYMWKYIPTPISHKYAEAFCVGEIVMPKKCQGWQETRITVRRS